MMWWYGQHSRVKFERQDLPPAGDRRHGAGAGGWHFHAAQRERLHHAGRQLREHGLMPEQDYFHRRWEGNFALPRHSHRGAGRKIHFHRSGSFDCDGQAAQQRRIAAVFGIAHGKRAAARGHDLSFWGVPGQRPSDGDPVRHDQRRELLLSGAADIGDHAGSFRGGGRAAAVQGADDRGVCVPEIARAADHLSAAGLQVHGELSAHAVFDSV